MLAIPEGDVLDGTLPPSKLRLVQAWIEIHQEELMADWDLAVDGTPPLPNWIDANGNGIPDVLEHRHHGGEGEGEGEPMSCFGGTSGPGSAPRGDLMLAAVTSILLSFTGRQRLARRL